MSVYPLSVAFIERTLYIRLHLHLWDVVHYNMYKYHKNNAANISVFAHAIKFFFWVGYFFYNGTAWTPYGARSMIQK